MIDLLSTFDKMYNQQNAPSQMFKTKDINVVLDSYYKSPSSRLDDGEFKWNLSTDGINKKSIGISEDIVNISSIEIGRFYLPALEPHQEKLPAVPANPPHRDTLILLLEESLEGGLTPEVAELPFGGRFTIEIKEAGSQSYYGPEGKRHHFEFMPDFDQIEDKKKYTETHHVLDNKYHFSEPLREMQNITLVFRNPDYPIRFLPDVYYNIPMIIDESPYPGPFVSFSVPAKHLSSDDHIIIQNCNTGSPKLDTYVNRKVGHYIEVRSSDKNKHHDIVFLKPKVSIGGLNRAVPQFPQQVNIYVTKRRMRIPIRFRCIRPLRASYM